MSALGLAGSVDERLLRTLAEQLKLPLLQIARSAELHNSNNAAALQTIEHTADAALRLIDSYLLSIELANSPMLELEPVSVSAVLQDTAHTLYNLAKQYDCELEVKVSGKYMPVMAHPESLRAAFACLAHSFVEQVPEHSTAHRVVLGAHTSVNGLVAGAYTEQKLLIGDSFKRGKLLMGSARQASPMASAQAGAGIFVADSLFTRMETTLKTSRHNKLNGLAAVLLQSKQLSLV